MDIQLINQTPLWNRLEATLQQPHYSLPHLFRSHQERISSYQFSVLGITLNYAYQALDQSLLGQLMALLNEVGFDMARQRLFAGEKMNFTEERGALHMALRCGEPNSPTWPDSIQREIDCELQRLETLTKQFQGGVLKGFSGDTLNTVVNLGIGGSDLGPKMVVKALEPYQHYTKATHFLANPDPWALQQLLSQLHAPQSLFILSSKSLSTLETLENYYSIVDWLKAQGCTDEDLEKHFVVVTSAQDTAREMGFSEQRLFAMWDHIGGRYSLWSAIGLSIALTYGWPVFKELLAGASAMDWHFKHAPAEQNLPVMLALLGVLNRNFLHKDAHLMAIYDGRLSYFTEFIQQLDMESNGKHVNQLGQSIDYGTSPLVWGGLGINGQHAYYQAVHQGRLNTTVDFIAVRSDRDDSLPRFDQHQTLIHRSMMAQAQAMALGRDEATTRQRLIKEGYSEPQLSRLVPHRCFEGGTTSNLIWLDQLNAHTLGALIATYEHKVFTQSVIWQINPFDQWGVELGKTLLSDLSAR
ncbi:MAG: glucose-6-phosphate isomerase [Ferrovum sp. 37-45-19]|jgi:glucose-6-phosphate isomerase|uniref:glucose-6-phosphate isomerase n=1 Tax=Ferrovum sp. JA12 TaxID=1356299 RepID=UPI0007025A9D|nr:glucose-6-phosphate isomerase [Ferrovum sp. JA12]OYV79174.1 MAG: glucose-6-phosphate isomerase [Ferrovum sp. 21-44-67]OYV93535.1 MAG: glucose-6-phosphate isomerase [Ferrovum sp. 37-45-19]OZB33326.1 MAG: glucose-6-phosphate isomerase [Ferrovum sp. 34-44-207]HQT81795.1 glucose-6-phosphate isomerase [Ferrovaceae bacterium]KRH79623.1 glucose-6-phosphate isomerase [Ferrovum sp. JA12]